MARNTILVVDDEQDILELLRYNLTAQGYDVLTAETGEKALETARKKNPSLIVLDLMLPGIDGLEVCKTLKSNHKCAHIPIVMLTAKGEESDIVVGLELGADDYVTKPFSPKVLTARIRRLLKKSAHQAGEDGQIIHIHELSLDTIRHEVTVSGKTLELTLTEFKILQTLMKRPGMVFTRYQIVDSIHGGDYPVTDRAVDVQIVSLRKKLGKHGKYIETVRGVGYRFGD